MNEAQPDFKKIALGLVVGTVLLVGVAYAGYLRSQKSGAKITLPGGTTYLGEGAPGAEGLENPPTAPQGFTAGPEVSWDEHKGNVYPYSFKFPNTLNLGIFPNDPSDAVAVSWGNIPPEQNILLNVENISDRDPQYVGKVEEYARNWHQFFSGLVEAKSVERFINPNGLVGYRAIYVNSAGQSPNIDIFFEIPNDPNRAIHLANGILDPKIFDRIIDSLEYEEKTE